MATGKLVGANDWTIDAYHAANFFMLSKYQAVGTGKVTELRIKAGASGNVKVAIYADDAGAPGALLNAVDTSTAVSSGWNTITFPDTEVTKDTWYWVAFNTNTANCIGSSNSQGPLILRYKSATYAGFTFPDPAGTSFSGGAYSIVEAGWGILKITPTGIASLEAFGTPTLVTLTILEPSGIASAEAFGLLNLAYDQFVLPTAIPSAEAFGTPTQVFILKPTGIPSQEAFGIAQLNFILFPTGIASAEAFGTATLIGVIYPVGIPSEEAFGTPQIIGGFVIPIDYPDWVQPVNIVGQTIGHLAMNIVAQAISKLNVDIIAQTIANLAINVVAQQVGVKIEGEWQSYQGNWKYIQAYYGSLPAGGSYYQGYTVPAGKALYVTGMGGAWHSTALANYDHFMRGTVNLIKNSSYLAMLGGESGCGITFPTPIKVTAGENIKIYGQNFSNVNEYHWVCWWGYEVSV